MVARTCNPSYLGVNGTSDTKEKEGYMEMLKSILKMEIPDYLKKQAQHLIDLHS